MHYSPQSTRSHTNTRTKNSLVLPCMVSKSKSAPNHRGLSPAGFLIFVSSFSVILVAMGFRKMRQVILWALVCAALGFIGYAFVQGVPAPPPLNLGPGITLEQSPVPSTSRPAGPTDPTPSGAPTAPATTGTTPPAPSTIPIPSTSAPVKPLPPSDADDDDDDDDNDGDIDD